jgi:ferric-dicitrate binding protein FerR (iron transport regulator)
VSDYLFDKSGTPDPEVEELEQLLAPLAYRGAPPRLPLLQPSPSPSPSRRRARAGWIAAGTVALAAAAAALVLALRTPPGPRPSAPPPIAATPGEWLATGARIAIGAIGTVTLEPGARARVVASGPSRHELELVVGTLAAEIHAPPRVFVIRTPRATITDLGCAFTLTVDAAGYHRLVVTEGAVAVDNHAGQEITVRAGAEHVLAAPATPAPPTPAPPQPAPATIPSSKKTPPAHRPHTTHEKPTAPAAPPLRPHEPVAPGSSPPSSPPSAPSAPTQIRHDALKGLTPR